MNVNMNILYKESSYEHAKLESETHGINGHQIRQAVVVDRIYETASTALCRSLQQTMKKYSQKVACQILIVH